MVEIREADKRFLHFREEMTLFRNDLKEYYGFFVEQCEKIMKAIDSN